MSTSAGLEFNIINIKSSLYRQRKLLNEICGRLDDITNNGSYGVACEPTISRWNKHWNIWAHTHWDYTGKNGKIFIKELKRLLRLYNVKIKIFDECYF